MNMFTLRFLLPYDASLHTRSNLDGERVVLWLRFVMSLGGSAWVDKEVH